MSDFISVDVPRRFTDTDGTIVNPGVRPVPAEAAKRWAEAGHTKIPGPVAMKNAGPQPEPEPPVQAKIVRHRKKKASGQEND